MDAWLNRDAMLGCLAYLRRRFFVVLEWSSTDPELVVSYGQNCCRGLLELSSLEAVPLRKGTMAPLLDRDALQLLGGLHTCSQSIELL
jgi:hypothetical protein